MRSKFLTFSLMLALMLSITASAQTTRGTLFDFTGTNRTDFTVLTLSATGQTTWKTAGNPAPAGANQAFIRIFNYGVGSTGTANTTPTTDYVVPFDFSGDSKAEVAVWRRGNQGIFYVSQFPNGTGALTIERSLQFGQTGDDPRASGDYDGDGKADYAVARYSGTAITWYILTSTTNTFRATRFGAAASSVGYQAVRGADFNGDGRDELLFISLDADDYITWFAGDAVTGALVISRQWGDFTSDYAITPADYTGDGRADFVAVRQAAGGQAWYISNSATNAVTSTVFGISDGTARTDEQVRGDFDGDGRQDIAVWRRSNQTFYWINSSNGSIQGQQWGASGDRPIGFDGVF